MNKSKLMRQKKKMLLAALSAQSAGLVHTYE